MKELIQKIADELELQLCENRRDHAWKTSISYSKVKNMDGLVESGIIPAGDLDYLLSNSIRTELQFAKMQANIKFLFLDETAGRLFVA